MADSMGSGTDPADHSDRLTIRGLRAYGHTGFFAEEQQLGQWFEVDLCLWLPLAAAGRSDALEDSLDYGSVARAVQELVEQARFRTIERLAAAISERVLAWPEVRQVETTLTKLHPPIPGFSGQGAVTLRRGRGSDAPTD
ncbi:MAG: dihydroneopterin aldolase [Cyanobacteriota bacterium]